MHLTHDPHKSATATATATLKVPIFTSLNKTAVTLSDFSKWQDT